MKSRDTLAVFNRGRISRHAIARTDVSRVALSATIQTNYFSSTIGPMSLRPGLEFLGRGIGDGAYIPFVFRNDDTAIIELSAGAMRVWEGGETLISRPLVAAVMTNGDFDGDISGWTDADQTGCTSEYGTGDYLKMTGTGDLEARRRQSVTIDANQTGTVHALRIVVKRGPLYLRVGTTAGDDDLVPQSVLRTGTHSIAFVPGQTSVEIELAAPSTYPVLVESIAFEGAGVMSLPTPWTTVELCKLVRSHQSKNVVFCDTDGVRPQRIERRDNGSWSVVDYEANDGPFLLENLENITLTPSALIGEITLTASQSVFKAGHVGALFQITSAGQRVQANIASEVTYTEPVRVTGVGNGRRFDVIRSGTWSGTLRLQRSVGEPGNWVNVATYGSNGTSTVDDGFDNSVMYYRVGFDSGDYTSGTAEVEIDFAAGSITGSARITEFTSATSVTAVVTRALGGTGATTFWAEGAWSDVQGWPTAVTISEGRLTRAANGRLYGSVSEGFNSYDPDFEGDAGPINKEVGEGATDRVNWLLPLQRMVAGSDEAEHSIRSNSLDEPITPSNYNSKRPSTVGSAQAPAVEMDGRGYFISKDNRSLYEMTYDGSIYDITSDRLTKLVPEIGDPGLVRLAAAKLPDVHVFCVRSDGTVAVLLRDVKEDVLCWQDMETDGFVEDVTVLPDSKGDRVFFRVRRTINGTERRYHERLALQSECIGGNQSFLADSFSTGTGPTSTLAGLSHLEGEEVVVWADGRDWGTFTVTSGQVVLSEDVDTWCVGLAYEAQYKSAKLAGQTALGLSLTQKSRLNKLGLVLADTHAQGVQYGPDFDTLDDMPLVEGGADVDQDTVHEEYDEGMIEFPGDWDTDNRICLKSQAPRPATILAVVANVDRQDED